MTTTVTPELDVPVREVMVTGPKTLDARATGEQVRTALTDDHVHMVLLVDGALLRGTVVRGDVPDGSPPGSRVGEHPWSWARLEDRCVAAEAPAEATRTAMVQAGRRRLAVVDDDGRLLGLLCLKKDGSGFCSDADVRARAADRHRRRPAAGLGWSA